VREAYEKLAQLTNLDGANLPPVMLSVSSRYQFCVDAGALAAIAFFHDENGAGMHDHIACSMEVFMSSLRSQLGTLAVQTTGSVQACVDAFAAGYLGRVQQELRLFYGEYARRRQNMAAASSHENPETRH
jgi:hypothetical protein